MIRLMTVFALLFLAFPGAGNAALGDVYQCITNKYLKISSDGNATEEPKEIFRFTWGRDKMTLTGPEIFVQYQDTFDIKFQNETFVSGGDSTWGIVQFNEKTFTLMVFVPRLDAGMLVQSKCERE